MLCILTSCDPTGSSSTCKILEKGLDHFQNTASCIDLPREISVCTHHKKTLRVSANNPTEFSRAIHLRAAGRSGPQWRWGVIQSERCSTAPLPLFFLFPWSTSYREIQGDGKQMTRNWATELSPWKLHSSKTQSHSKSRLTGKNEAVFSVFLKCKISE